MANTLKKIKPNEWPRSTFGKGKKINFKKKIEKTVWEQTYPRLNNSFVKRFYIQNTGGTNHEAPEERGS